jgi:hypothetical protein
MTKAQIRSTLMSCRKEDLDWSQHDLFDAYLAFNTEKSFPLLTEQCNVIRMKMILLREALG